MNIIGRQNRRQPCNKVVLPEYFFSRREHNQQPSPLVRSRCYNMAPSGPEPSCQDSTFGIIYLNKDTTPTQPRKNTNFSFKHFEKIPETSEMLSLQCAKDKMKGKDTIQENREPQKANIFSKLAKKTNNWFKTSEPSSNAFKDFQKAEFQRKNVKGMDDPLAAAKLNIPQTKLPEDAILPSGKGPDPEELRRRRIAAKKGAVSRSNSSAGSMGSSNPRSPVHSFSISTSGSTKVGSVGSDTERPLTGSTVATNNSSSLARRRR